MTDQDAGWIKSWLDNVASGKSTMSQRKRTAIDAHGGLDAVVAAAREKGVHLVQLTDDTGAVLVAASPSNKVPNF